MKRIIWILVLLVMGGKVMGQGIVNKDSLFAYRYYNSLSSEKKKQYDLKIAKRDSVKMYIRKIEIEYKTQNKTPPDSIMTKVNMQIGRENIVWKSAQRLKLSQIIGDVSFFSISFGTIFLKDVSIEVKENDTSLIEKTITDTNGRYILNKLKYDRSYKVTFSKTGYYSRFIWVSTYNIPDSLKEKKFINMRGESVLLKKAVYNNGKNPYERGFALLRYVPIKVFGANLHNQEGEDEVREENDNSVKLNNPIKVFQGVKEIVYTYRTDLLVYDYNIFIEEGGIIADLTYDKQMEKEEKEVSDILLMESEYKSNKQISDYEMKAQVQQLEKEKIEQLNKLNEAEIQKDKAFASAKENELAMVKQDQKIKEMKEQEKDATQKAEQEKTEAMHAAELKQRSIIIYSVLGGLLVMLVFSGFIGRSLRIRNKQNKIIVQQKSAVEKQKELVEQKNTEILDSIEYALRIQTAILPPQKIVKQYLENSFILYKPKDIVAGDFYWMEAPQPPEGGEAKRTSNQHTGLVGSNIPPSGGEGAVLLFAACDCTGHGVPGAMVSVVCHNALNRAVREFGLTQPSLILDKTAEIVIENFSKSEEEIKDGMDISLASIKYNVLSTKTELEWAGANNPLWIVRNPIPPLGGEGASLLETKADKQPIGMNEDNHPFTNHRFELNAGDTIYLFTDGYSDQFGGETGEKKLTKKRFKELILSIQHLSMTEQGIALDKFIVDYRKEVEQIDDILVMGVRV